MIYFVQAESGVIKIGFTDNWQRRFAALRQGTHETLTALLVIAGTRDQEQALLGEFAEHCRRGEWFSPAPEILAYIDSRKADAIEFAPRGRVYRTWTAEEHIEADRRQREYVATREARAQWLLDEAVRAHGVNAVALRLGVRESYARGALRKFAPGSVERILTILGGERSRPEHTPHYLRRVAALETIDLIALTKLRSQEVSP